jgi:hypothetical protein
MKMCLSIVYVIADYRWRVLNMAKLRSSRIRSGNTPTRDSPAAEASEEDDEGQGVGLNRISVDLGAQDSERRQTNSDRGTKPKRGSISKEAQQVRIKDVQDMLPPY